MSSLYPEVIACLAVEALDIKKMVYLFLVNYGRSRPDMLKPALQGLLDVNPPPRR